MLHRNITRGVKPDRRDPAGCEEGRPRQRESASRLRAASAFRLGGQQGDCFLTASKWRGWGLQPDYPMVAPNPSAQRHALPKMDRAWAGGRGNRSTPPSEAHDRSWLITRRSEGQGREVTIDAFGLLTCAPNAEVGAVHPKAMPVILGPIPAAWGTWLEASGRRRRRCSGRCRTGRCGSCCAGWSPRTPAWRHGSRGVGAGLKKAMI